MTARQGEHPLLFKGPMVLAILTGEKTQTRRVVSPRNSLLNGQRVGRSGQQRAIWDGLDWSRAMVDHDPGPDDRPGPCFRVPGAKSGSSVETWHRVHAIYQAADDLWGRETYARLKPLEAAAPLRELRDPQGLPARIVYRADNPKIAQGRGPGLAQLNPGGRPAAGWTPSIHMPRWVCRLPLRLASVGAGFIQDISEADAKAEGIQGFTNAAGHLNYGVTVADCWESTARGAFRRLWDSINARRGLGWADNPPVWALSFALKEE
mgnify:CR=1 FL=1